MYGFERFKVIKQREVFADEFVDLVRDNIPVFITAPNPVDGTPCTMVYDPISGWFWKRDQPDGKEILEHWPFAFDDVTVQHRATHYLRERVMRETAAFAHT